MISMTVGDDDRVEPLEIDAEPLDVVFEDFRVVTCVEENPLAPVFHQRSEPPISGEAPSTTERIVEDGDPVGAGRSRAGGSG